MRQHWCIYLTERPISTQLEPLELKRKRTYPQRPVEGDRIDVKIVDETETEFKTGNCEFVTIKRSVSLDSGAIRRNIEHTISN